MTADELRALITRSGLSVSRWARDVEGCSIRTVQRWLSGEQAIPASAADRFARIESVRATERRTVIRVRV